MRADVFGMFWRRMVPGVVVVMGLALIGGTAERQIVVARQVALAAAIDESPNTIGLADSNLSRLGTHEAIDEQLKMMHDIGIQNVRIGISWATLQLTDGGNYNWRLTDYDYVVNRAEDYGMGVLAVLHETPTWAGDKVLSGMPDDVEKFGDFVTEVATHFDGRISAYEVWNEPNAKFFLDPVNPENYTKLLIEAHDRLKSVDQDITVIGGVLGFGFSLPSPTDPSTTMNPVTFLERMYAAGAQGNFDALSFHPYKPDIKFSDQVGDPLTPRGQLEELRTLMARHGDEGLKIWATEYGLPTPAIDPTDPAYISPEKQAEFIKDFLENWGKVEGTGPIFIYSTRDLDTGSDEEQDTYGIWETDWTPKPAVEVIKDFIAAQNGNPIIDFIRNAIVNLAKITGAVIKGIVNVTVGIVNALVDATVWVVKTIAKVAGAVVQGIVDIAKRIGTAICNTVHAVVTRIQDFFNRNEPATAPAALIGARSLRAASTALTTTAAEDGTAPVAKDHEPLTPAVDLDEPTGLKPTVTAEPTAELTTEAKPTVTAEPTAELTTEAKPTATAEPKPTATAEPKPTATAEPKPTANPTAEPTTKATVTKETEKPVTPSTKDPKDTDDATEATKTDTIKKDDDPTAKTGTTTTSTKVNTTTSGSAAGTSGQESSPGAGVKASSASATE
ncbi:MAG: cellulase family glycosylhydrolase [Mycolicibacterium cosmeticum]|nr:cellulase family glycosylhydrolase [Mycolicibacterium cosmeticum]